VVYPGWYRVWYTRSGVYPTMVGRVVYIGGYIPREAYTPLYTLVHLERLHTLCTPASYFHSLGELGHNEARSIPS